MARDSSSPLTIALLDLDHFKAFNDTQGHVMGDLVLNQLRMAVNREQTCSIGFTVWDGLEDPDDVVSRADEAPYHAKRNGRDRLATHNGTRVQDCVGGGVSLAAGPVRTDSQLIKDLDPVMPAGQLAGRASRQRGVRGDNRHPHQAVSA